MSAEISDLPENASAKQTDEFIEKELAALEEDDGSIAPDETTDPTSGDETSADDVSATEDEEGGEDSTDQGETSDEWLDADLKAEATAMGFSEEELSRFSNRDEWDRAMSLFDKAAMKAGQNVVDDQQGRLHGKDGRFVAAKEAPAEEDANGQPPEGAYQVQLDPEEFDEAVIKEFTTMRDHYEQRFAQLEWVERQRSVAAFEQQFDAIVDSLGQADLFGEPDNESEEQFANRDKLLQELRPYLFGLQEMGRNPVLDKQSVTRVMNMTFAEHLSNQQRKQLTKKLKSQAARKLGGGGQRTRGQSYSGPLEDDPELKALHAELLSEDS